MRMKNCYRFGENVNDADLLWNHRMTIQTLMSANDKGNDCDVALLDELIKDMQTIRTRVSVIKVEIKNEGDGYGK